MEYNLLPTCEALDTLEACVVIEETCARIYRYFALLYCDNTDIANFWTELAAEEDQHADIFRLAVKTHGSDPTCLDDVNFLIDAIIANLNSLLVTMKQSPPQPHEAFLTAAILEHSIEKFHVETGKSLVNPELADLLSTMAHSDHCHREIMQRMK